MLEVTQQIDEYQQARASQSANLLRSLLEADDLDDALQSALPMIDELFLGTLEANLVAARERGNPEAVEKLERIQSRLNEMIMESLPPSLQLAQKVLDEQDVEEAKRIMDQSADAIDDQFLSALMGAANRMEGG
ncbi:MAG: hypothetical protein R3191_04325, partial [Anaerolineales bacterium]|nr:hypothetical protein [Anaerolineales bacterium]